MGKGRVECRTMRILPRVRGKRLWSPCATLITLVKVTETYPANERFAERHHGIDDRKWSGDDYDAASGTRIPHRLANSGTRKTGAKDGRGCVSSVMRVAARVVPFVAVRICWCREMPTSP